MIFKGEPSDTGIYLTAECELLGDDVIFEGKGLYAATGFEIFTVDDESKSKRRIGRTYLAPMPGCCGVVVSYHTHLDKDYRGTALSDMFRKLKYNLAKELGYTIMIATTQMDNIPGVANMLKSGYKIEKTFTNRKTNNLIGFGLKTL